MCICECVCVYVCAYAGFPNALFPTGPLLMWLLEPELSEVIILSPPLLGGLIVRKALFDKFAGIQTWPWSCHLMIQSERPGATKDTQSPKYPQPDHILPHLRPRLLVALRYLFITSPLVQEVYSSLLLWYQKPWLYLGAWNKENSHHPDSTVGPFH